MPFITGDRVHLISEPAEVGIVQTCHNANLTGRVCVSWETSGRIGHCDEEMLGLSPRRPNFGVYYASGGWLQDEVIASFTRAADAVRDQMDTFAETISAAAGQINEIQGGEEMPEEYEVVSVPHTTQTRASVFEELNLRNELMSTTDEQQWLTSLREVANICQDVEWRVRRGQLVFGESPVAMVRGTTLRIDSTPVDVAKQVVQIASNNRVGLAPAAAGRYKIAPVSSLELRAWEMFSGGLSFPYSTAAENPDIHYVNLRTLRDQMRQYQEYLQSSYRIRYVREAMRANMQPPVPDVTEDAWSDDRMRKFDAFLSGIRGQLQPERNPFLKLPMLPHKTLSSRPWGIEIEAPHIDGVSTPEYWELKGDGSLRSLSVSSMPSRSVDPAYSNPPLLTITPAENAVPEPGPEPRRAIDHRNNCAYWDSYDACTCNYEESQRIYQEWYTRYLAYRGAQVDTRTGEWNSPVLRSFHSRGLKYLTGELEPRNVNDSAGIHVHVEASDLTPEQAVRLSIIYTALEPLFESEYKRGGTRRYCQSVNTSELIERFRQARSVKSRGGGPRDMRFGSRYWTVNLASLQSHGTIEFRAMGPVYNYEHLVRWAYFVREMVNISKASVPQSAWSRVRTIEDLVTLFSKYGKETPTPDWAAPEPSQDVFSAIVDSLGVENRRVPHTQSLTPGSRVRLVNDDYTAEQTYMRGDRTQRVRVTRPSYEYSF